MEKQKYTITNLILNYIVKYELAIQSINQTVIPSPLLEQTREQLRADEIDKLGELIAYPIGYNKALTVQRGQVMPSNKNKSKIFTNFKNVQDYIDSYTAKSNLKPSIELSTHLNKILMKDIVEEWDLARLRKFSEKPYDLYDTWYKLRDYYPNIEPREYFNDIFDDIVNSTTNTHKLIQFCLLLYEYIDKAPFFGGNQITAIATLKILSKTYGLNPHNSIPFFKAFFVISEDIESAFNISKSKRDLTIFIEAVLYTLSLTVMETSKKLIGEYDKKVNIRKGLSKDLNSRQVKIIEYLNNNPRVTRKEYTKMMGVSFMTSYRDLQELLDKEYIQQKGKGRGTYYIIPDQDSREQERVEREIAIFG
jgi:uncharacterized membrane protein